MKPPRSILDPTFRYQSAAKTNLKATFARIRAKQKQNDLERDAKLILLRKEK